MTWSLSLLCGDKAWPLGPPAPSQCPPAAPGTCLLARPLPRAPRVPPKRLSSWDVVGPSKAEGDSKVAKVLQGRRSDQRRRCDQRRNTDGTQPPPRLACITARLALPLGLRGRGRAGPSFRSPDRQWVWERRKPLEVLTHSGRGSALRLLSSGSFCARRASTSSRGRATGLVTAATCPTPGSLWGVGSA